MNHLIPLTICVCITILPSKSWYTVYSANLIPADFWREVGRAEDFPWNLCKFIVALAEEYIKWLYKACYPCTCERTGFLSCKMNQPTWWPSSWKNKHMTLLFCCSNLKASFYRLVFAKNQVAKSRLRSFCLPTATQWFSSRAHRKRQHQQRFFRTCLVRSSIKSDTWEDYLTYVTASWWGRYSIFMYIP